MKRSLLTPRWIITTLLVIAAVAVMVRLGFWQLDRLAQRRTFNAGVEAQINAAPLDLNTQIPLGQLTNMEYRPVIVRGSYDAQNEIILRNQINGDQPGYHLLTPLHIAGASQAVLVDRGFIPMEQSKPVDRLNYVQKGEVTVRGVLRLAHVPQFFGVADPTLAPGETHLDAWNAINIPRIQSQTPYPLLPIYIEAAPSPAQSASASPSYPIASLDQPDLSEGPHLGYAFQWFSFAAVLALGYPYFVRKQLQGREGSILKNQVVTPKRMGEK